MSSYAGKFERVESLYNDIKPLVSKYHTKEQDVRPLNNRRKKWERIVKVDDNCYALIDGFGRSDALRNVWWRRMPALDTPPETVKYWAPIVWERHPDRKDQFGDPVETVTIRGVTRKHDYSRIKFLRTYLPFSFSLWNTSTLKLSGKELYLPRTNEDDSNDKNFLVFERNTSAWGPKFNLISEEFVRPKIQWRIDKELKSKIKPHMDSFYQWIVVMAPVLPRAPGWQEAAADDYRTRAEAYRRYRMDAIDKLQQAGVITKTWGRDFVPEKTIEAIVTQNVELRLALAAMFLESSELQQCKTKEDFKFARSQYNNWINKVCGLVTKKEVNPTTGN